MGLVQAAILADVGHHVVCMDIDQSKIEGLQRGIVPIYEPGLEALIKENAEAGRIKFTTDAKAAVDHGYLQFIAVGTPPDEDGSADLQYVLAVAETIALHMSAEKIIVDKSTVPVGTADKVSEKVASVLNKREQSYEFYVCSNPEFLKEGSAINDCQKPDRIIVGCDSDRIKSVMRELYAPFNRMNDRMIFMGVRSAELTKYAANCLLATKISFANEMANLSEALGADFEEVRQGIGSDTRIGYHFIYPGCGYGGSCFPKDVQALIRTASNNDMPLKILEAVEDVNNAQKQVLFSKIQKHYACQINSSASADLRGKTFALWGLAFKPNTDDMREASSRVLMEALWQAGAKIQAYDPEAMEECQRIYGDRDDLLLVGTQHAALKKADALVICTEWKAFRAPDFDSIKEQLIAPVIFDGRNLYEPSAMKARGIKYYAIGRNCSVA